MVRAKGGAYQHWKIVNATTELHPMHIHQVHFLVYAENGRPIADPLWLDTVNVPYGGSVDGIMGFTAPVIKEIGRASCRGRGEISVGAGSLKKKKYRDKRALSEAVHT